MNQRGDRLPRSPNFNVNFKLKLKPARGSFVGVIGRHRSDQFIRVGAM